MSKLSLNELAEVSKILKLFKDAFVENYEQIIPCLIHDLMNFKLNIKEKAIGDLIQNWVWSECKKMRTEQSQFFCLKKHLFGSLNFFCGDTNEAR